MPKVKPKPQPAAIIPAALDTPTFMDAWVAYCKHRAEKRSPLTSVAIEQVLKRLEGYGATVATTMLWATIENNWLGVKWVAPDRPKEVGTSRFQPPTKLRENAVAPREHTGYPPGYEKMGDHARQQHWQSAVIELVKGYTTLRPSQVRAMNDFELIDQAFKEFPTHVCVVELGKILAAERGVPV